MKMKEEISEFLNLPGIEYFLFEEEFVEEKCSMYSDACSI
jgi:hypothetical protein